MMKVALAVICLFVSGCMYQTVDQQDLAKAEHFCSTRDGIFYVESWFHGKEWVRCRNGDWANLIRVIKP